MPSRRGKKKKAASRMDAAVAALTPLGFSKPMIRRTVRNLLKIYDDDAAWCFVEEANYKLVIETIVEGQENEGNREEEEVQRAEKIRLPDDTIEKLRKNIFQVPNPEEEKTDGTPPRACTPSTGFDSSQPSSSHAVFRRPCFGWISEDEEDEEAVPVDDLQVEKRIENPTLSAT